MLVPDPRDLAERGHGGVPIGELVHDVVAADEVRRADQFVLEAGDVAGDERQPTFEVALCRHDPTGRDHLGERSRQVMLTSGRPVAR